jgi:hypothetical protein
MKRPSVIKWKNIESLRGLLFFAESLEDMLFHHTIDYFRAPALNTHSRVIELLAICSLVNNGQVPSATVTPFLQELTFSVAGDPVLEKYHRDLFMIILKDIERKRNNSSEVVSLCESFMYEISKFYWQKLKNSILDSVKDEKHKRNIYKLAQSFVAEVENKGYSREFLYYEMNNFFFKKHSKAIYIDKCEQVRDFLDTFEGESRKWRVVFRCTKEFMTYEKHTKDFNVLIQKIPPTIKDRNFLKDRFIGKSIEFPLYVTVSDVDGKDPYFVRENALMRLELFVNVCNFYDHRTELRWSPTCLVVDPSDISALIQPLPNPLKCGCERDNAIISKNIDETLTAFSEGYHPPGAIYTLVNAMDYHRTALETKFMANQLLDLWAAIEGLLPNPNIETPRITYFVENILPSITLSYSRTMFDYIVNDLIMYGKDVFDLINSVEIEGNIFDKSVCVITCQDMCTEREKLYSMLEDSPLFKNRIFEMHDIFHSSENISIEVKRKRQWISWHVQRIYTTRNQIVHSARAFPYLKTLTENLHCYFDTLILSILALARSKKIKLDIDVALKMMSNHEQYYIRELEANKEECNKSNFKRIIFGAENPISPYAS